MWACRVASIADRLNIGFALIHKEVIAYIIIVVVDFSISLRKLL